MKKFLLLTLSALIILSAIAVCAIPAYADDVVAEGAWDVTLDAYEEYKLSEGEDVFLSTPGYEYTDRGLEIIPPVYQNSQAKFTAITKNKVDTSNFSVKIAVDEFDTEGDCWISFTFWSEKNGLAQGSNMNGEYGYGWSCLLRDCVNFGTKDGEFSIFEGFSCGTPNAPGGWSQLGGLYGEEFTPNVVDGKQIIELKVVENIIYINDHAVVATNNTALRNAFRSEQGLAYFGISVKSGVKDAPVKFTVLEMNGIKPTGSDRQEPVNRGKTYAPITDASEIPVGTPGVLFDGTLRAQNSKLPTTSQCTTELTSEGTIKVNSSTGMASISFDVNNDYSVDIKNFRYVAIILKNYCTCPRIDGVHISDSCLGYEGAGFFYYAGDVLAPDTDHRVAMNSEYLVDITPEGSEDYYIVMYQRINVDEFAEEESRIHGVRFDATGLLATESIEIVALGFFRSGDEIAQYIAGREEGFVVSPDDISFPDDTYIEESFLCDECGEELDQMGNCPNCDAKIEDDTTTTRRPSSTNTKEPSGCGSFVGVGAIAIVLSASVTGLVIFKKRKED